MNDLVSIIVPIYNSGKTLDGCLAGLSNQVYKNIEIVLVNDGSSDNSEKICKKYSSMDSRFIYYYKQNGGVSSARNFGINNSKGKYLMFVDADDEVDVELVSKLILDSGGYDLISVGRKDIYSDHDEIIDYGNMEIDINFKMNQKLFDELFNKRFFNTVYTKLFVKEKVTAQFDEGISYGEDCLFILEYLKNCTKLLFLSDCYYNYYIYEESLTTKLHNNEFYVIKKINKSICELMRFWELNNTDCVDLFSSNSLIFYIQKRFENNSISVHELKRIYNDNWVKKVLMKNLPTSRDWRIYKSRCIYVVYFYFKVKVFLKKRKKYYEKNWNFNN